MHSLLLGNGINRLSKQLDWVAILEALADSTPNAHAIRHMDRKPLSLLFEELCSALTVGIQARQAELQIKKKISRLLGNAPPPPLLPEFTELFDVILTTNYDHAIESSLAGPFYQTSCLMPEARYSLFRRTKAYDKVIWHIHGDISYPETIVLGYDHYAGYLQKIRNYQVGGLTEGQIKFLLKHGPEISRSDPTRVHLFSWVDHFLRDHLHIVGLGLDFTEIDLWWLLVYKRRRNKKTGHTFYYSIQLPGEGNVEEGPHFSLLRSLGVHLHIVNADSYYDGYKKIPDLIKKNMIAHPNLLQPHPSSPENEVPDNSITKGVRNRAKDPQLALRFPRH